MQTPHLATTVQTRVSQSEHLWLVHNVTVYTIDSYASKVSHSDRMDNCFSSLVGHKMSYTSCLSGKTANGWSISTY
ncbi:hypothetical protein [Brasilonema sennae]|uniref:hypothetical protein n=1 Tax=Brasilonema sennae TaxID=1397703 RepID=UPI00145C7A28